MTVQAATINSRNLGSSASITISENEARAALEAWGKGLVKIAQTHKKGGNAKAIAADIIRQAYNYDEAEVLFKPTLASVKTFRTTFEGALSYFVGGNANFSEDAGFALNPWKNAEFDITGIYTSGDTAIVMGNKHLTKEDGSLVIANFSMGFKKNLKGEIKIVLHHSSLPYKP
ncbi:MAG: hypothetical protein JNM93_11810 [Bacteriovoracaceae bacterium]|nr:hypothetical protein [Bacteriovoracaceae bacterium]